ncbi:MAG: glycosyltransferase, partial [Planctomycetota bacterium]
MRVAFLTNIISPYRKPVLSELAATPGWSLRVLVNADSEFDRGWSVDWSDLDVVRSRSISLRRRVVSEEPVRFEQVITLHVPVGLWGDLRRFRPDAIISHELGPRTMVAAAYARAHRVPLIIWSYQSRISATQGERLRGRVRRALLRQATAVVGMGIQARD